MNEEVYVIKEMVNCFAKSLNAHARFQRARKSFYAGSGALTRQLNSGVEAVE